MLDLPIEIWQEILIISDFISQLRLMQLCQYFYKNLKITNFYNIDKKFLNKLNSKILENYKDITKLNIFANKNVTNIEHLINLKVLNIGWGAVLTKSFGNIQCHVVSIMIVI